MNKIFLDNAYLYFEKDLVVIPCKGKRPVVNDWTRYSRVFPSELLISTWESKFSGLNIGLVTGELSGVIAIDIDKDSALSMVPLSPVTKKGLKGETRFFKYNGETNFKRHDLGIELLSTGNQSILPPSIHPDSGLAYTWNGQSDLISYDVDDLPILDKEFFKVVGTMPVDSSESTGRHNALVKICSAMLGRGEGVDDTIAELISYDETNHDTPYFTDKTEAHRGLGYNAALKMVTSVSNTITQRGGDVTPKKIEICFGEEEPAQQPKEVIKYPDAPGILKEIQEYVMANSNKPRAPFAMASALGLLSVLISNKVRYGSSAPCLYQMLIAESGQGKDVPLKAPKEILIEAGQMKFVGIESYRGDKSLVKRFEHQRERIDTVDEISKLGKSANSTNLFQSNIAEVLTEIWNSPLKLFMGQTTSEETTGMTFNPCLTLMGATTPDAFSRSFSKENVAQGFAARFIYIFEDEDVPLRRYKQTPIPEKVLDFIEFWANLEIETTEVNLDGNSHVSIDLASSKPKNIASLKKPLPVNLPAEDGVEELLDELGQYYDNYRKECDESLIPIVLRAMQQIEKIAIISAVATSPTGNPAPILKLSDVRFAAEYIKATTKGTAMFFSQNLLESKFHLDSEKVLRVMRKHGKPMTRSEINQKLKRSFKSNELHDPKTGIVCNLIKNGSIIELSGKSKTGKDVQVFTALGNR